MNPTKLDTGEEIDSGALRMAKAIRQQESGGKTNAVGDVGTSTGAFQFQKPTWKLYAKEVLGDENAIQDKANENKVAYTKIKKWKDSGWNPEQIAAAWNTGEERAKSGEWKNMVGDKIINGQKIHYDTPSYVNNVINIAQQLKQKESGQNFELKSETPAITKSVTPYTGTMGTNPNDSTYGKIIDNSVTRGIMNAGNFLTGGGAKQLGGQVGSSLAGIKENVKGLVGGKDNSKYIENATPMETLMGAGKVMAGAASVVGVGKLLGGLKTLSPSVKTAFENYAGKDAIGSLTKTQKLDALGNALEKGANLPLGQRTEILKAIEKLAPSVKESTGLVSKLVKAGWTVAQFELLRSVLGEKAAGVVNKIKSLI